LTHIDLFSGIGGFALAAQWAGFKTEVFCEKDEFCQRVLCKRFGAFIADSERMRELQSKGGIGEQRGRTSNGSPLIPDIRDFDGTKWRGATLLTGGFPCQPFSQAGQRRGTDDDRHLWPEMLRVISEARPSWVVGENVAGIINMELDTVLADLEGEGYEVGTVVLPACAKNAPHRRDRVWIIANSRCEHGTGKQYKGKITEKGGGTRDAVKPERPTEDARVGDAPDPPEQGLSLTGQARVGELSEEERKGLHDRPEQSSWQIPWHEVATRFCRVDDGVSDRVHRLKALGNAIVPQVAYE